jgi:hypothetical protein
MNHCPQRAIQFARWHTLHRSRYAAPSLASLTSPQKQSEPGDPHTLPSFFALLHRPFFKHPVVGGVVYLALFLGLIFLLFLFFH